MQLPALLVSVLGMLADYLIYVVTGIAVVLAVDYIRLLDDY